MDYRSSNFSWITALILTTCTVIDQRISEADGRRTNVRLLFWTHVLWMVAGAPSACRFIKKFTGGLIFSVWLVLGTSTLPCGKISCVPALGAGGAPVLPLSVQWIMDWANETIDRRYRSNGCAGGYPDDALR